jgi:hypothetical protein
LLRVATIVLSPKRRRKLVAVTQAPWFEPGLFKESQKRRLEEAAQNEPMKVIITDQPGDPKLPVQIVTSESTVKCAVLLERMMAADAEWKAASVQSREVLSVLLALAYNEMRSLNEKVGTNANGLSKPPTKRPPLKAYDPAH